MEKKRRGNDFTNQNIFKMFTFTYMNYEENLGELLEIVEQEYSTVASSPEKVNL